MFRFHIKNHDLLSVSGGAARIYAGAANGALPVGANSDLSTGTPASPGAQAPVDTGLEQAIGRLLQPVASALSFASDWNLPTPTAPMQLPADPAIASPVSLWSYVFSAPLGDWSALKSADGAGDASAPAGAGGKPAFASAGAAAPASASAGADNGAAGPRAATATTLKVPSAQTSGDPDGTASPAPSIRSVSPTTEGSQEGALEGGGDETIAPEMAVGTTGSEMPAVQTMTASAAATDAPAFAPAAAAPTADAATTEEAGTATLAAAAAVPNKIALENMKQGNSIDEWGISGDGDANIQGFATEISTNVGGTVDFKIATDSTHYRIDIYRLGYYGGDGARLVDSIEKTLTTAQDQPHPIVDMSLGLIDCGNWSVSASWGIPEDAVSGVYIAKLVRLDGTEGESHIPFVVRDDASTSDIVFQTSDTTWQAYNAWGGASLYFGEVPVDPADMIGYMPPNCSCGLTAIGRASAVSYNRPIITNTSPIGGSHDFIFGVEHSAIQWLEQNGYDVSYISGVDSSRNGQMILNHDAFLSVGHDEYWSAEQRAAVEAARDSGVNLAFWGGNDMYWKIRWENSIDGNGTPYRTMVCYKETWGTSTDPSDVGTGTWRDPRYADPGQEPENSLIGTMFTVDGYRTDEITVSSDFSNLRFWRDTDIADLEDGEVYTMPKNILGYEWNSDVENGFRPAGLINMSLSTVSVDTYLRDYGTTVGNAEVNHSLTMYRAESGALVFSSGTVFWSWALNDQHSGPSMPTDRNVQQAMVNMFADMGIQPTTLVSSLILASESTDTVRPTSTITTPVVGASFVEGQHVTVTGTAADLGGGVIAGVEISTDGGDTWFKATGRENWSFNWVVQASGTYTIMSRAVDDSLNLETPSAGKQVTVNLPSTTVSLWTQASKPAEETTIDRDAVEVGLRFETTANGTIEGIRFYKGFYNTGSHRVSLWDEAGNQIATGISTNESITGWQTVKFSSPVQVTAGTTYIASYHTKGFYSSTLDYFDTGYQNGFLKTDANASVYSYTDTPGTFPGSVSDGRNYWVDVLFNPGTNMAPVAVDDNGFTIGRNGMLTLSIASLVANDTDANGDPLTITAVGGAVNGTVTLNTQNGTVVFQPDAGYFGPASFTYTVSDGRSGTDQGTVNLTVDEGPSGVSLFNPEDAPVGPVYVDGTGVELGMKFVASSAGEITGIRFYKANGDTGTHTGALYDANGNRIASVTFVNESLSGWQTATFSSPIQITAGQTYTASYHSSTGTYYATGGYFNTARTNGPLTAPSSAATDGGNGVFRYGASGLVPTQSYNASNYWVDVVFKQSTANTVPVAANDNGYVATYNTPLTISATLLLGNDDDADGDTLVVTGVGNATNGTVAYNSQTNAVTFTPTSGYTGPASFTYTISDGRGGTDSATVSLTVAPQSNATSLFTASDTPAVLASSDTSPVELGMKFVASASGQITGLRYYKSAQDNGTHVGSLWTSTGQLITSATFVNESASGWQTVLFAQPVNISAGTTYVASYQSNGRYAVTSNYFTTTRTNGDLSAPSSGTSGGNGVFAYGSGNEFPTASWNSSNYWVDVLFERSTTNQAPVAVADLGYQTQTGAPITIQASALLGNDSDPDGDPLSITGVSNAVNGQVSFDSVANTVTFTPTAGYQGAASFRYTVSDGQGGTATAQVSLNVNAPSADQTLFEDATPTIVSVNDNSPVNLGMKFQADVDGWITAIRFYKAANNNGPHTGYLWSADGDLITSATFTNETSSGWQTVDLAQDVEIDANTTYLVSYSTNGNYSATPNGFASEVTNGNLHALSSTLSGGNGVYGYGSAGIMPASTYNSTNYYVDVAFRPQLAA